MAVGFIQLIFTGTEKYMFNNNPTITFFKIYYRRHSNFYIQNYSINGNINNNKLISFNIPNAGDLLYKNYLFIDAKENLFELFTPYANLYNTLNTNILDFYDSYSIKINDFIKQNIIVLKKNKINVEYSGNTYFTILCDYQLYPQYLDSLKNGENIYLQSDGKYYYNINEFYNFYSFVYNNINCTPIDKISFISPIIESIVFENLEYLRIDIQFLNLSIKLYRNDMEDIEFFKKIVNLYLENINCESKYNNKMNVDKKNIYMSLNIKGDIINYIAEYIYEKSNSLKIDIIQSKTSSSIIYVNKTDFANDSNEYKKQIENLFQISKNYIVYIDINFGLETEIILTLMKNSSFLGNISGNDYDHFLIKKETDIISSTNLYYYKNPTNLFIKIVVYMICTNVTPSLQNFVEIINSKNFNYQNVLNYYNINIGEFNNKLLDIVMKLKNFVLNKVTLIKLLFSSNIKNYYNDLDTGQITPFTNQQITNIEVVVNYFFYENCINNFSINTLTSKNKLLTLKTIIYNLKKNNDIDTNEYLNYYNNNFLYSTSGTISSTSSPSSIETLISYNIFQSMIYSSFIMTRNVIYKKSYNLYQNNGLMSSIFENNDILTSIFPLSGTLFLQEDKEIFTKFKQFNFTKDKTSYIGNLLNVQNNIFNQTFDKYKINPRDKLTNTFETSDIFYSFNENVSEYYDKYAEYFKNIDYSIVDDFLDKSYGIFDDTLIKIIMPQIYSYTNKELFNNSFDNLFYEDQSSNNENQYNKITKFIFLQNSPLYRIFYLVMLLQNFMYKTDAVQDIVTLRDFTKDFLLTYLDYFNNNEHFENENNFDFNDLFNNKYLISNNLCCYGDINIFENDLLSNYLKNINKQVAMYSSFYLSKISVSYENDVEDVINTFKNNFDDLIITLFIQSLYKNKQYFEIYEDINDFVNLLFSKNDFMVAIFFKFLSGFTKSKNINPANVNNKKSNEYYYFSSYYTMFSVGSLFDNINHLKLNTTNIIYNTTKLLINNVGCNKYSVVTNPGLMRFKNIYQPTYVSKLINKIKIPLQEIFKSRNEINMYSYYFNLMNYIISIMSNNDIIKVSIMYPSALDKIMNVIDSQFKTFNDNNNINISFSTNKKYITFNNKFKNYSLSVIFLYIIYFFSTCMKADINNFIGEENNGSFLTYLMGKYSKNIYEDYLNKIIIIINSDTNFVNIDYFHNLSIYTLNFVKDNFNNNKIINNDVYENGLSNKNIFDNYYKNNNEIIDPNVNQNIGSSLKNELIEISNNIYNDNNKIYYTLYNKISSNVVTGNLDTSSKNIKEYFDIFKDSFYSNSLRMIEIIYSKLINLNDTIDLKNNFSRNMCTSSLQLINNFYKNKYNYYHLLYYKKVYFNFAVKTHNDTTKIDIDDLYNKHVYSSINSHYCGFLNININNSIYFENNINSIIYLLSSNFVMDKYNFDYSTKNKLLSEPLYDIVKLFNFYRIKDVDGYSSSKIKKIYIENTHLYSNQESFLLLNYDYLVDNKPLIQNEKIIDIIELLNTEENSYDLESYYKYLDAFLIFCKKNALKKVTNLKLESGELIFDYFFKNIYSLYEYVSDYLMLNDYFSPRQIFNDIIEFKKSKDFKLQASVDHNEIKIKIFTFLYFSFITFTFLPKLLVKEFTKKSDTQINLEYNFNNKIYDASLNDIYKEYNSYITFSIQYIYSVEAYDYNAVNAFFSDKFIDNNIKSSIIKIINMSKKKIDTNRYFINLSNFFIDSYMQIVGDENNNSSCESKNNMTITSLINSINYTIGYDINDQNISKYAVSFFIYNKFNFSVKNEKRLYNYFSSGLIKNYIQNLNKVNISDFNISFILSTMILEYFGVYYDGENFNINYPLFSLKNGNTTTNLGNNFQKGLYTFDTSKINFYTNNISNTYSKISNVINKSIFSNETKNLNVINPSTFDNSVNFMNYNFIYEFRLDKYYNEKYNYYNYENNHLGMYKKLYEYYTNLLKHNNLLNNLKSNNYYYQLLFYELFSSFISHAHSEESGYSSQSYLSTFNQLIDIYVPYNFTYKQRSSVLFNPNNYVFKSADFDSFITMYGYLTELYFYQIFSFFSKEKEIENMFYQDLLNFFVEINNYYNPNMVYSNVYYNVLYKLYFSQIFIVRLINHVFSKNFVINIDLIENINYDIALDISSGELFMKFISQYYNDLVTFKSSSSKQYASARIILNLTNKKDFLGRINQYINKYLFYTGKLSTESNLEDLYNIYFDNVKFSYISYNVNTFVVKTTVFTKLYIESIIYSYLNYYFLSDMKTSMISSKIGEFLDNTFTDKTNDKYYKYINDILFNNDDSDEYDNKNDTSNIIANLDNKKNISSLNKNITEKILKSILNQYWGFSIINKNKVYKNTSYQSSLVLLNSYYYSLEKINLGIESHNIDYTDLFKNLVPLNILFNLIQKLIPFIYIDSYMFRNIIVMYLTKVNFYVTGENIEIISLDNSKIVAAKLDFLNSNFIPNNIINNYYKNVQLSTILDAKKYNIIIDDLTETYSNDDFIKKIYLFIYKIYGFQDENTLGINMYNNTLINLINNYSSDVVIYNSNNQYVYDFYNTLFTNINLKLEQIGTIFGGKNNNSYNINKSGVYFNKNGLKNDNNFVTIFTLVMNNTNKELKNNCLVIFFYYMCFLTWSMTRDNPDSSSFLNQLYTYSNYINEQLLIDDSDLFKKMNIILMLDGTNKDYIKQCNDLFENILSNKSFEYDSNLRDKINKSIHMSDDFISYENMFLSGNNKARKWKYFMGLIVDFNDSEITKIFKSINNAELYNENIQSEYIEYITEMIGGLVNDYGIINTIENVSLMFNDNLIDSYDNFNYKIFYDLISNIQKKEALSNMLGIDDDYITNFKIRPYIKQLNKKQFILPINFFYNQANNTIPLISMLHTKIKINFKFFENKTFLKNNLKTSNLMPSNMQYTLNADYIIIEEEERIKKTKYKIDNIINRHGYHNVKIVKKISDIINDTEIELSIPFDFQLYNLCERLIWSLKIFFDDNELINNTLDNLKISDTESYLKYNIDYKNINHTDFIRHVKLYIDGGLISGHNVSLSKDYSKITSLMNIYKYATFSDIGKNYNCNSFSLEPDVFQPTGALNMSMFKYFTIKIILDKKLFIDYLNNMNKLYGVTHVTFSLDLSLNEYNIIRYQSGMSGMLFIK
jgi:hypothetical protein